MPTVRLIKHDPAVLKNMSEMQRLFAEYGRISPDDAKALAHEVRDDYQVSIDVEDPAKAAELIRELSRIYIKAEIVPSD